MRPVFSRRAPADQDVAGVGDSLASQPAETEELKRKVDQLGEVLLEFAPPPSSNIEALIRFREAYPEIPVLVISTTDDREHMLAAFDAGATGYILQSAGRAAIAAAARLAANSQSPILGRLAQRSIADPSVKQPGSQSTNVCLTARQKEVLHLAAKGLANKNIARRLKVTEDTVKAHLRAAYAKLGVGSRTQALLAAAQLGIKL